jgi:hypothetical protein
MESTKSVPSRATPNFCFASSGISRSDCALWCIRVHPVGYGGHVVHSGASGEICG